MSFGLNRYNYSVNETLGVAGSIKVFPCRNGRYSIEYKKIFVTIPLYEGQENVSLSLLFNGLSTTNYNEYGKGMFLNYYVKVDSITDRGVNCVFYDSKEIYYKYENSIDKYVNITTTSYVEKINNKYYLFDKYGNKIELGDVNSIYPKSITFKDGTVVNLVSNNNHLESITSSKNNLEITFERINNNVRTITITSDIIIKRKIQISYSTSNYLKTLNHYKEYNDNVPSLLYSSNYLLNIDNNTIQLTDDKDNSYLSLNIDQYKNYKLIKSTAGDGVKKVIDINYGEYGEQLFPTITNLNTGDYEKAYNFQLNDTEYNRTEGRLEKYTSYVITNDSRVTKYLYDPTKYIVLANSESFYYKPDCDNLIINGFFQNDINTIDSPWKKIVDGTEYLSHNKVSVITSLTDIYKQYNQNLLGDNILKINCDSNDEIVLSQMVTISGQANEEFVFGFFSAEENLSLNKINQVEITIIPSDSSISNETLVYDIPLYVNFEFNCYKINKPYAIKEIEIKFRIKEDHKTFIAGVTLRKHLFGKTYEYDENMNITKIIENGNETIITYNDNNLPSRIYNTINNQEINLEYNSNNKITKKQMGNYGTINYEYTNNDLTKIITTTLNTFNEIYEYDNYHRVKSYTNYLGDKTNYNYSNDNEITSVFFKNKQIDYDYNAYEAITKIDIKNNNIWNTIKNTYNYNLLTKIENIDNDEVLGYNLNLSYNDSQEITEKTVKYNDSVITTNNISRTKSSNNNYYQKIVEIINNYDNIYCFNNGHCSSIKTTNKNETTFSYDSSKRLSGDNTNVLEYHYNGEDYLDRITYKKRNDIPQFSLNYEYNIANIMEKRKSDKSLLINYNYLNDCISDYTLEDTHKNGIASNINKKEAYTLNNIVYTYSEEFMNKVDLYPLHGSLNSLNNDTPYSTKQYIDDEYHSKWFVYDKSLFRTVYNASGHRLIYKLKSGPLNYILLRFKIDSSLNRKRYILSSGIPNGLQVYIDENNKVQLKFGNQQYETNIIVNTSDWYYLIISITREGYIDPFDQQMYNYTVNVDCNGYSELYSTYTITKNMKADIYPNGDCSIHIGYNFNNQEEFLAGKIEELIISTNELTSNEINNYIDMKYTNNFSETYDLNNRLTSKHFNTNSYYEIEQTYEYNINDFKLQSETLIRDQSELKLTYTYNDDRISSISRKKNGSTTLINYNYNNVGYLVEATKKNKKVLYDYDEMGNIIKKENYLNETKVSETNFIYSNGKLVGYTQKAGTEEKEYIIDINANGYPNSWLKKNEQTGFYYTWNGNNLVKVIKKENGNTILTVDNEYDVYGYRTKKIVTDANNNVKINNYYYKDGKLIREETTDYVLDYIYNKDIPCGLVKTENNKQIVYYYVTNQMGEIEEILFYTGKTYETYEYDAYGKIETMTGSNIGKINSLRYKGYVYDEETQLYWVSSRYYSPELCRWISPDDIEYLDPSSINGLNLYAYCENDPINNYDPTGHFAISALIIGAIIGAAIGFGGTVLADYVDDGQIFNGSISAGGYIANTLVGGLIGGLTGGIASSSFTFTYPTLQFSQIAGANGLTFGAVSIGSAMATISGTSVVTALGLAGIAVMGVRIGKSGGYRVDHHYPNDHDPTHVHISGDDGKTRVDINGNPIQGDRPMTPGERKAFWKLIEKIIEALKPWM